MINMVFDIFDVLDKLNKHLQSSKWTQKGPIQDGPAPKSQSFMQNPIGVVRSCKGLIPPSKSFMHMYVLCTLLSHDFGAEKVRDRTSFKKILVKMTATMEWL